ISQPDDPPQCFDHAECLGLRRDQPRQVKQNPLLTFQEAQFEPAEQVIHQRLCVANLWIPDQPLGSNRVWLNLSQSTCSGTPYCRARETAVAKESMSPETVDPSLAILMNISPGRPSSYRPTVT